MVKYVYDAWGKCKVLNPDGTENTAATFIGNINPFRYRSYYYDTNSGLYYLQTRFYDPETGRFLNADTIDYLEPDVINGLNLYAYCGNNPVMCVDPSGHSFIVSMLIAIAVGAFFGAATGGISAAVNGTNIWGGIFSGALVGGALGLAMFLGGTSALVLGGKAVVGLLSAGATATVKLGISVALFATTVVTSAAAGMGSYAIKTVANKNSFSTREMFREGGAVAIKGVSNFALGMLFAVPGGYNNLVSPDSFSLLQKIRLGILRGAAGLPFKIHWMPIK